MADEHAAHRRKRARLACLACNARRVKCNVAECRPCHNCAAANVPCETRESRRGKHPRRPRASEIVALPNANDLQHGAGHEDETDESMRRREDEVTASHVLASLSSKNNVDSVQTLDMVPNSTSDKRPTLLHGDGDGTEDAVQAAASTVNRPHEVDAGQEDDGVVFLGESSSIRDVSNENPRAQPPRSGARLRHSVPRAAKAEALVPPWETERRESRIRFLRAEGAFSIPSTAVCETLLKAYFRWFHTCFAIIDEPDVFFLYEKGQLSPLLLQAMLFIGAIHCEDAVLQSLGLGNRQRAKYLFYTRAKDIYDAEYETRQVTVIQALFLLSFWRAGAMLEKDARHWLGAAISLAQTKALHRSAKDMDASIGSLRRRIWWSIYIRERQCAAALGLPNRIRDEDCDVEWLARQDFQHAFDPSTPARDIDRYITYAMGMTELAHILGKIVHCGYLPNKSLNDRNRLQIREELLRWRQHLPPAMQVSNELGDAQSFHAGMIHLAYNNLWILLYRSAFSGTDNGNGVDANVALQATSRNSRIIEDMLSDGNIGHAQIHVITNLFNTLCIHVIHLRRLSGIARTIAEHKAKLCLSGLQELQRTWEVTNWVLQLFFQYLDRSTAARLALPDESQPIAAPPPNSTLRPPDAQSAIDGFQLRNDEQPATEINLQPTSNELETATPWSWTTDEANQFLFSRIENDFSFGEGGVLEWSPEDLGNVFAQLDDAGTNFQ